MGYNKKELQRLRNIFGNLKNGSTTPRFKFERAIVSYVPDDAGVYRFFDKDGKFLYIGVSHNGEYSGLKHRLESYYEKDDFDMHPTKKQLRPHIDTFNITPMPIEKARQTEFIEKQKAVYNMDNMLHMIERTGGFNGNK